MSEALIGVVIGGLIGSIIPVINLVQEHNRWMRERKLEYLKQERERLNITYVDLLKKISDLVSKDKYSLDVATNILLTVPSRVAEEFWKFVSIEQDVTQKSKAEFIAAITLEMRKSLSDFDKQIKDLIG